MIPDCGQIIWVNFNPHKRHEPAGRHPSLVISPAAYNGVSNCILACPITSNTTAWPWKLTLPGTEEITGAVLVDQIKSIDAGVRNVEATGQAFAQNITDDALARLATLTR